MAIAAAAKRLPTSLRLLGTVAVAKDPDNLPSSLSKPPEVGELALLCLRAPGVRVRGLLGRTCSFCLRNRPLRWP